MKAFIKILLSLIILSSFSCKTKKPVPTAAEIKILTTKQYESTYEDVFKSVMVLLQSEQFSIEQSDMTSGLIIGTKNIYKKELASLTKTTIIIDKLNENLTEVKLTVYSGIEKTRGGRHSDGKTKIENMIEDPEYYNRWFNNLQAEIERRKALR